MFSTSGFLLTRQWRDTPQGVELVFWLSSERGPLRVVYPGQKAVCFIERTVVLSQSYTYEFQFERKPLHLKTLQGVAVDGLYFYQQRDLLRFAGRLAGQKIALYESDIKPTERFLMERFVFGGMSISGELRKRSGYLEAIRPKLCAQDYPLTFHYVSLDIETSGLSGDLYSIAVVTQATEKVFMLGDPQLNELPTLRYYASETQLLQAFFAWLQAEDPDFIIGWNVVNFDLDFLQRKCQLLNIPFQLARGRESASILQPQTDAQLRVARIPGRVVLDGIDTLRSATWSFENYSLEHVAQKLLGRGKLIETPTQKLAEIQRLFAEDKPQLAAYNLEDCRLVIDIFKAAGLFEFALQRAKMTGLPMERQGGSVAAFDNLYLPALHRHGYVAPDVGANPSTLNSPGGYVMNSRPGLYDNVLVLDFKSLYPSIIRTFKIDPLGMAVPGDDPIEGFLEATFSRTTNILPALIEQLWAARDQAKAQQNKALSQAIKIIMNSFYGVLGSSGCRFFDPKLASSITKRGHEIINQTREFIEQQGYAVIYGDTDSVFVLLGQAYSEPEALRIGHGLAHDLNRWWTKKLCEEHNIASFLEIEFETHYLRFLMPTVRGAETGSKKRYAGYIRQQTEYQMVFKGLETVRTDWTPLARNFQRELFRRVFFNQAYEEFIQDTVRQLQAGSLDDQLVYSKRLRRKLQDYVKNVPPHVQAARKQTNPGSTVRYLITLNGPEPVDENPSAPNYQHYLDRQLAPAADSILYFLDTTFAKIIQKQISLF